MSDGLFKNLDSRGKAHDGTIMPFGVYQGKTLGSIPDTYWIWFLRQRWCDKYPELVEYANTLIEEDE